MRRVLCRIQITPEEAESLRQLMAVSGIPVSSLVRIAVDYFLKEHTPSSRVRAGRSDSWLKQLIRLDPEQDGALRELKKATRTPLLDLVAVAVRAFLARYGSRPGELGQLAFRPRSDRLLHTYTERAFWSSAAVDWTLRNRELARKLCVSEKVVSRWRRKLGKPKPTSRSYGSSSAREGGKFRRFLGADWSKRDSVLAKEFKCSRERVRQVRKGLGKPKFPKAKRQHREKKQTRKTFKLADWNEEDSVLAQRVGCTVEEVREVRRDLGRPRSPFHKYIKAVHCSYGLGSASAKQAPSVGSGNEGK